MTAARWAREYGDALLTTIEHESNDGWPDLPWPPVVPSAIAQAQQVRILERLLAYLYDAMLGAERERIDLAQQCSRRTWLNTGQPKRTTA